MERLTERDGLCVKSKFTGDFGTQNILHRLAEYEDLEEQGLLQKLPCAVGYTVYFVCDTAGEEKFDILEGEVVSFSLQNNGLWMFCRYECGLTYWYKNEKSIGKTIFLTKEAAEQALRNLEWSM